MIEHKIRSRDRDTIIQSLRAGVVPRNGIQHIQVARVNEVNTLIKDIDHVSDGGTSIRFIIGEYGSGKTFFLNLIRQITMEKKCVSLIADLSPERRLHASGGQARLLFSELMKNLSTRSKPDGGALSSVVERFITTSLSESKKRNVSPELIIHENLEHLSEMVCGYDFAEVISAYWQGHDKGNDDLKADALRWLRGEFSTKTDSRMALGVRTIIDDNNTYDMLKLMARFVKLAGYSGLFIFLDEMVNLYKIPNSQARNSNYEKILYILNDSLQGTSSNLGFVLAGTPEFLYDTRKGLYSYPALQSRLSENVFAVNGLMDFSGPVIRLDNLSPEDVFVLLTKLRHVFSYGDASKYLIPDEALKAFMIHCQKRIGDAYFRTPRNTIVAFINLLAVLEQNVGTSWEKLLKGVEFQKEKESDIFLNIDSVSSEEKNSSQSNSSDKKNDNDLPSFKL